MAKIKKDENNLNRFSEEEDNIIEKEEKASEATQEKTGGISAYEKLKEFFPKTSREALEKEALTNEQMQELRQRIEAMDITDNLKKQAKTQAQSIKYLDEEKKIKKLLEIAKQKGVVYAVNVAKKINDSYILDTLHDILAKEGFYKEFVK